MKPTQRNTNNMETTLTKSLENCQTRDQINIAWSLRETDGGAGWQVLVYKYMQMKARNYLIYIGWNPAPWFEDVGSELFRTFMKRVEVRPPGNDLWKIVCLFVHYRNFKIWRAVERVCNIIRVKKAEFRSGRLVRISDEYLTGLAMESSARYDHGVAVILEKLPRAERTALELKFFGDAALLERFPAKNNTRKGQVHMALKRLKKLAADGTIVQQKTAELPAAV